MLDPGCWLISEANIQHPTSNIQSGAPMRDDLLLYYERELTYLRQAAVQFAEKYPKIASRLVLEPAKCEDPHVERLLEAFAFLAARVHLKIDDEFPQITVACGRRRRRI